MVSRDSVNLNGNSYISSQLNPYLLVSYTLQAQETLHLTQGPINVNHTQNIYLCNVMTTCTLNVTITYIYNVVIKEEPEAVTLHYTDVVTSVRA